MTMDLQTAQTILKPFVCNDGPIALTEAERSQTQAALLHLVQAADFLTLGVCADDLTGAIAGLNQFLHGLEIGQTVEQPPDLKLQSGCYIKHNTRREVSLFDDYDGPYRGILIGFQSDLADGFMGTYGHFPLDLFA
ncbi:MAG: DUF1824 family protein [Cyanobacteria bacterium P01_H01_bin.121]